MRAHCEWIVFGGLRDLIDFTFRPVCLICREPSDFISGKTAQAAERLICRKCAGELKAVPEPQCRRCGSPRLEEKEEECGMCLRLPGDLGFLRSASLLSGIGGRLIHLFKYRGWKALSSLLAMEIVASPWSDGAFWDVDLLLPVPISSVRYRERGYNQSELLARELSDLVGIPMEKDLLRRVSWKRPQVGLTFRERLSNVLEAFALSDEAKKKLNGKRVIIVDDVITTGATVYACYQAIRKGGTSQVSCLSFGRADVDINY
jgi:ComF family protein